MESLGTNQIFYGMRQKWGKAKEPVVPGDWTQGLFLGLTLLWPLSYYHWTSPPQSSAQVVLNGPSVPHIVYVYQPYSGEVSREKTFANWWKIWFSWRKLSQIARFYRAKGCHAPKFYRENFCKYPQNWNSRKFSPLKVSHYTVLTRNVFGPSVATLSCARKGRENLCLFVYFVTSFWSSCTKWTSASAVQTNNWAKFIILLVWWASARTWRDHYHHVSSLFCSETVSQVQTEKEALSRHTSASSQKEKGCVSAEREEIGACIGLHG